MQSLCHLIYASTATVPFDGPALVSLLDKARQNNEGLAVTGMLLYTDGNFFQVLEGDEAVVAHLFEMIGRDKRHDRVVKIILEPIAERAFGNWSMGFTSMTPAELTKIPGASDIFLRGTSFRDLDNGRAKKLLSAFLGGRWHHNAA